MPDLGAIKADLKTWERAFKAEHGREPRKDDIKADAVISEKYRVYNKSRKAGASQPAASMSSRAGDPAKQAAPSASSSRPRSGRSNSPPSAKGQPSLTPSRSGRFTNESARATFLSPVKRSPAVNPFLVGGTPVKKSPLHQSTASASSSFLSKAAAAGGLVGTPKKQTTATSSAASPAYHHPLSPNKLAALISSHSTRGAPNDVASLRATAGEGYTPRTKARKRLNGELAEGSTPIKRRRSGAAAAEGESTSSDVPAPAEEIEELIIGPTPLKPSDQARRALPVAASLLDDDGVSSSDDDMQSAAKVDPKRKGKAAQGGKPRMLFAGGKSTLVASSESSGKDSTTLHPFFTSRTSQPLPAIKAEPSPASSSRAPTPAAGTGEGDGGGWTTNSADPSTGTTTTKKARAASPPPATGTTKPPPAKKPRKYTPSFGKINMTAAAKAKAEQAATRLQADGGGGEAGSDESEDEVLKRVVQSHLLGRFGQNRTGRGRAPTAIPSPIQVRTLSRRAVLAGESDEESGVALALDDDPQIDPGDEGLWQSDLDDDLLLDGQFARASPRKKQNTLYGLPQTLVEGSDASDSGAGDKEDGEKDDEEQDDDRREPVRRQPNTSKETQDLPPHLLSLLSLRSPQIASAKTAKRTADTFRSIFSHSKPSEEEPPTSSTLLAPRGRGGRSAKSKRGSAPPPPPPFVPPGAKSADDAPHRERKKPKSEVWGLGDVGRDEMDEIEMKDDEWDSEPEGWKATGVDDEDW